MIAMNLEENPSRECSQASPISGSELDPNTPPADDNNDSHGDDVGGGGADGHPIHIPNDSRQGEEKKLHETGALPSSESGTATAGDVPKGKDGSTTSTVSSMTMTLNVAYEALESMRITNLQLEFGEAFDVHRCVQCLQDDKQKERLEQEIEKQSQRLSSMSLSSSASSDEIKPSRTSWLSTSSKRWSSSTTSSSTPTATGSNNRRSSFFKKTATTATTKAKQTKKPDPPCLACGSPVCPQHSNADLRKQQLIAMCQDCSRLLSPSLTAQALTNNNNKDLDNTALPSSLPSPAALTINELLEVYDRALLVLRYSSAFIPDICTALQDMEKRHNHVGLGSSATGVLSGVVGVAAAATIFTPVGPPLLLASILFGSTGAAAQAGSERVNYRSDASQMAHRILVLYALVSSLVQLPATLDDMLEGENGNVGDGKDDAAHNRNDNIIGGSQSKLHWTRAAMNGLKPLTVGAMSAISVFTESRELHNTVQRIQAGHPCEKADRLRQIQQELSGDPGGGGDDSTTTTTTTTITTAMTIPTDVLSQQLELALRRRDAMRQEQELEERRQWKSIQETEV